MDCAQKKSELLGTRLHDTTQMMDIVIDVLRKDQTMKAGPQTVSVPMTGSQGPISSTPGYMSTSTPMGGLAARERETELRQLLSDCEALISTYSTDLMNRSDRYGLRSTSADSLLSRLQLMLGTSYPSQFNNSDVLLLLQRLQKSESDLFQLKEKQDLLLSDMMSLENQRDAAQRKQREGEQRISRLESDGRLKEQELDNLKRSIKMKEDEIDMWRRRYEEVQSSRGTSIPLQHPSFLPSSQPPPSLPSSQPLPSSYALAEARYGLSASGLTPYTSSL